MTLQAPANYSLNLPDPLQAFQQGQMWRDQQTQRQASQQKAQELQAAVASLPPNASISQINEVLFKYPELVDRFKNQLSTLTTQDIERRRNEAIPVYAALVSGNASVAEGIMRERAEALRNSGNEAEAKNAEKMAELIKASPGTASTSMGMQLSALTDPTKFAETFSKFEENRRATELQPSKVKEQDATTTIKGLEAKYAPDKIAAELGLTEAQTLQAKAAATASKAAARKSDAEAAGANSGLIPPEKRPELELKLRNEYASRTSTYQDVKQAYGRVQASQESAAGDLSLIFNYMKMLDPGSAVREGEFANAQNAASVPDRIRNMYNKLISGERLNAGQRKMFASQAEALYNQAATGEKTIRSGLTRIATSYGVNPSNIFYEAVETAPAPPAGAATAPAAAPPPSAATAGGVGSQVRHSVTY